MSRIDNGRHVESGSRRGVPDSTDLSEHQEATELSVPDTEAGREGRLRAASDLLVHEAAFGELMALVSDRQKIYEWLTRFDPRAFPQLRDEYSVLVAHPNFIKLSIDEQREYSKVLRGQGMDFEYEHDKNHRSYTQWDLSSVRASPLNFLSVWLRWHIGLGTDGEGKRNMIPKLYLTMQAPLTDTTTEFVNDLLRRLSDADFDGQLKIPARADYAITRRDNVVIHCRNERSLEIAQRVVGGLNSDRIMSVEMGVDQAGMSHNEFLSIKAQTVRQGAAHLGVEFRVNSQGDFRSFLRCSYVEFGAEVNGSSVYIVGIYDSREHAWVGRAPTTDLVGYEATWTDENGRCQRFEFAARCSRVAQWACSKVIRLPAYDLTLKEVPLHRLDEY